MVQGRITDINSSAWRGAIKEELAVFETSLAHQAGKKRQRRKMQENL